MLDIAVNGICCGERKNIIFSLMDGLFTSRRGVIQTIYLHIVKDNTLQSLSNVSNKRNCVIEEIQKRYSERICVYM